MSAITPEAHDFLDSVRDLDEPAEADRLRSRAALIAKLGVTAAATLSVPTVGARAAVLVARTSTLKSVILFALLGAASGGAVCAWQELASRRAGPDDRATAPMTAVPPAEPRPSAPSTAPVMTRSEENAAPLPRIGTPTPLPALPREANAPRERASGEPRGTESIAPAANGLEVELELIRKAHEALRAGQPARALAYLDEHAARFPNGALSEERTGAHVLASCALHRSDAPAEAKSFLATRPSSPLAGRVRGACGLDDRRP